MLKDAQDCFLDCSFCLKHLEMVILSKCQEWSVTEMYPMTFYFHFGCIYGSSQSSSVGYNGNGVSSSPSVLLIILGFVKSTSPKKCEIIKLWYPHLFHHRFSLIIPTYVLLWACLCSRSLHKASSASCAAICSSLDTGFQRMMVGIAVLAAAYVSHSKFWRVSLLYMYVYGCVYIYYIYICIMYMYMYIL